MPKPPITRFANLTTSPSSTNNYETINITQLTQEQIDAIQDPYLTEGAIVYNTTTQHLQAYENDTWVDLDNDGNVIGPNASVAGHIATFADITGSVIQDSGVNINQVPAAFQKINVPLVTVNEISNLGHIRFNYGSNDIGIIFVDTLMPVEFITNNYSGTNYQVCSLFTGALPSSSSSPSALVELQSTTGAFLVSRMNTTQMNALTNPIDGMIVYNNILNNLMGRINGSWISLNNSGTITEIDTGTGLAGGPITSSGTIYIANTGVTAGTYNLATLTVNAQGQLTSASTQTVTQYEVLVGGASNAITSIAMTNGQLLIGSTGADPIAAVPSNGTNISWTTGTGTIQANLTGQIAVANGGTGNASATAYSVLCGGTTATGALQSVSGLGTTKQVLTSNGSSSLPTWQNVYSPGNPTYFIDTTNSSTDNFFAGTNAGNNTLTGSNNTGVGIFALSSLSNGTNNVGIGYQCLLYANSGSSNTGVGTYSLSALTTGIGNSTLGASALVALVSGNNNIAMGQSAGANYSAYNNCTFLGYGADAAVNNLTNACAIGYNTQVAISNAIVLGSGCNVGIGTSSPAALFSVGSSNQFQINSSGVVNSGIWNGNTIGVGYGGTGVASISAGGVLYGNGTTSAMSVLAAGMAGYVLRMGATNPEWDSLASFGVSAIIGTANQVLVNGTSGSSQVGIVTLTTPQSIGMSSTPTFGGLTVNGNIGINNNSPANYLDVWNNANSTSYAENSRFVVTNNVSGSNYSRLLFGQSSTNNFFIEAANQSNVKGNLILQPYGGNVGIGATSPASLFSVGSSNQFQINNSGVVNSGTWNGNTIGVGYGGTGVASISAGGLLYGNGTTSAMTVLPAGTAGYILTMGATNPQWSSLSTIAVTSITGTANEVLVNGTSGSAQIGAITLTTPQAIGTSSNVQFGNMGINTAPISNAQFVSNSTLNVNMLLEGTQVSQTQSTLAPGINTQIVLSIISTLSPGALVINYVAGISNTPTITIPNVTNPAIVSGYGEYINLTINGTSGKTMTTSCGIFVDAGSLTTATVTNAYGAYFKNPGFGTTKTALYTDNLSIGYTTTTPPSNGIIVSGNVGIGTSSPQSLFHVANSSWTRNVADYGIVTIDTGNSSTGTGGSGLSIGYDTTNNWTWLYSRTTGVTNRPMIFGTPSGSSYPLYVSGFGGNTGLVGIGTASPTTTLDVVSGSNTLLSPSTATSAVMEAYSTAGGHGASIALNATGITGGRLYRLASYSGSSTGLFRLRDDTAGVDRIVVDSSGNVGIGGSMTTYTSIAGATLVALGSGNVGIGTPIPNYPLHVYGSIYENTTITNSNVVQNSGSTNKTITSAIANFPALIGQYSEVAFTFNQSQTNWAGNSIPIATWNASSFSGLQTNGGSSDNLRYTTPNGLPVGVYMVEYLIWCEGSSGIYNVNLLANNSGSFNTIRANLDTYGNPGTMVPIRDYFAITTGGYNAYIQFQCNGKNSSSGGYYLHISSLRVTQLG